ncbi:MAG: SagB/ThcOx family dehydrogenase [Candidatus Aminicenantes bacterium]|nr:SagB/ThcOx family dehydrogenase [Candidatus Aminicenantes bacterium]
MRQDSGERFQEETKYVRGKLTRGHLDWRKRSEPYKSYPGAARIKLIPPQLKGGMPLWEAIHYRRSVRDYKSKPLNPVELSQLLWASQGVTATVSGYALRAAPSAGALYPVETYVSVQNVVDINPGIYHYAVREHELELVRSGDFRESLAMAALDQDFLAEAAAVFAWTAVFARSRWKYGERAYRYVYLDAGHIAQNLALAAVALGLGTCQVAALYDDEVNAVLGVDGKEESILYLTSVGRP